jgi:hypothetical protein
LRPPEWTLQHQPQPHLAIHRYHLAAWDALIAAARDNLTESLSHVSLENPDIEPDAIRGARDDSPGKRKRLLRVETFAMQFVAVARKNLGQRGCAIIPRPYSLGVTSCAAAGEHWATRDPGKPAERR